MAVTTTKNTVIKVVSADSPIMRFWADQYSLPSGACTTLVWNVQNVQEVYLDDQPQSESRLGIGLPVGQPGLTSCG